MRQPGPCGTRIPKARAVLLHYHSQPHKTGIGARVERGSRRRGPTAFLGAWLEAARAGPRIQTRSAGLMRESDGGRPGFTRGFQLPPQRVQQLTDRHPCSHLRSFLLMASSEIKSDQRDTQRNRGTTRCERACRPSQQWIPIYRRGANSEVHREESGGSSRAGPGRAPESSESSGSCFMRSTSALILRMAEGACAGGEQWRRRRQISGRSRCAVEPGKRTPSRACRRF